MFSLSKSTANRDFGLVLLGVVFVFSCTGTVPGSSSSDQADDGNASDDNAGQPFDDKVHPVEGVVCASKPAQITVAANPLARLTAKQYARSVQALMGPQGLQGLDLNIGGGSARVHGFENFEAQSVSDDILAKLDVTARQVGKLAGMQVPQLAPCQGTSAAQQETCGKGFIASFGKRAFRRPLDDAEAARWLSFFKSQLQYGYEIAIGALVEAFVMSPQFLYRIEKGMPVAGAKDERIRQLTSHELAARLSYFLTDGPPDANLQAAADSDDLQDAEALRAQALRLAESPDAKSMTASFHDQWLNLEALGDLTRDHADVTITEALEADLRQGMRKFVESVYWDDQGGVNELFTAPYAFVNKTLAPIYGGNGADDGLKRAAFSEQRAGLLTQAGWLAQHAHQDTDSPIFRGHFIAERVLCDPPPPVPDGLMVQFPAEDPNSPPITTRARTEEIHESVAGCGACHAHFDLYGFAFGHYDNVGKWREKETVRGQALEINARASITATRDMNGDIDGAFELGRKLGTSQQVAQCVATQWFRYAYGRTESDADACALEPLVAAATQGGSLKDVTLAVVLGDAFRFVRASE